MSRVRAQTSNSGNRSRSGAVITDGERPGELLAHLQKQTAKQRQQLFEQITNPTKLAASTFTNMKDKNRAAIPLLEKKKVTLSAIREGDAEFCAANYCNLERAYYTIWQAPKKDNMLQIWRFIWQEGVKLIVSLSDQFSETDESKCYPYWSQKEGGTVNVQAGRFVITTTKKNDFKGYAIYDLVVTSSDTELMAAAAKDKKEKSTDDDEKKSNDGDDEKKPFKVSVLHLDSWAADTWPDLDTVATFVQTLTKKEIQILRKSIDQFTPPVVIQSHDGIGRAAAVWVLTSLNRDIEGRSGFDVDDLVRKMARFRPGSLTNRTIHCATYALAYRSASLYGWIAPDTSRQRIKEIQDALKTAK